MHCPNKHTQGGEWNNIHIARQLCCGFFEAETYNCTILKLLCVDKGEREKEREGERRGERERERGGGERRREGERNFERERESDHELIDK